MKGHKQQLENINSYDKVLIEITNNILRGNYVTNKPTTNNNSQQNMTKYSACIFTRLQARTIFGVRTQKADETIFIKDILVSRGQLP